MAKMNATENIRIEKLLFPNLGIGTFGDTQISVKNTLPGQLVSVKLSKKRGAYIGKLQEVIENSPIEIEPQCKDFGVCGGCTYQNLSYDDEIKLKEQMVLNLFSDAGISGFEYLGILKAPCPEGYRNKMEFSFGDAVKSGPLSLGMRRRGSNYEVVTSELCNIVDADFRRILLAVLDFFRQTDEHFYHRLTHEGALRHLIIRKAAFTGEILVNLVTTSELRAELAPLVNKLTELKTDGVIVGILYTLNNSVSDAIKCDELLVLYGRDYFTEKLLGLRFKISPFSFFQTNSAGAENLYGIVCEFAGDVANKTIFDLYCGTGTIAQLLAGNSCQVIGIELSEEAVAAAVDNAKENGITNCRFIAGDVLKEVEGIDTTPDIIILDPPRDGIHPKAIGKIINFGAPEIVYVSCKASSLARDVQILAQNGYKLEKLKICDMFPRTYHVECVCLLTR